MDRYFQKDTLRLCKLGPWRTAARGSNVAHQCDLFLFLRDFTVPNASGLSALHVVVPLVKVLSHLHSIGKSALFCVFQMAPNCLFFGRKAFNHHATSKVSAVLSSSLLVNKATHFVATSIVATYGSLLC